MRQPAGTVLPLLTTEMAMATNWVQFQQGMSMSEFLKRYGTEQQALLELEALRWPDGFRCPRCGCGGFSRFVRSGRGVLQCCACRHQTSVTAGTMMDSTKLALRTWLLAMYLISQAKTGLSALALKRQLGVNYRTAWLLHHKIMEAMAQADAQCPLEGNIQLDDAYLGGERPGTPGRGSENKVAFVAAVEVRDDGRPMRAKLSAVPGFTSRAVAAWASANLRPGSDVLSDGLACFAGVIEAGCAHSFIVVGDRKPRDLPRFRWVNTVIANAKTMIHGAHKHFRFAKYPHHYLGAFCFRFNNRFDLRGLVPKLFASVIRAQKAPERIIRGVAAVHA
jgi:hypothetical protein